MLDAQKAMVLYLLGAIPIFLGLFIFALYVPLPPSSLVMVTSYLCIVGVGFFIVFRFHPRVQHYMEALNEFDRNYRYEKEAQ